MYTILDPHKKIPFPIFPKSPNIFLPTQPILFHI